MKHRYLIALFGLILVAGVQANDMRVSLDDIVLLNQRGLSDQTILLFLENRELGFTLSVEVIDKLVSNGVSEEIISYLLVQEPPRSVPATTYVNVVPVYPVGVYPAYYYTPYYYGASYSFGFANYPHSWFGHYAGAGGHWVNAHYGGHNAGKHLNQNGHGISHAVQHATHDGGGHAGSALQGALDARHRAGHSSIVHAGGNRPHAGAVAGQSHAGGSRGHSGSGPAHLGSSGRGHSGGGHGGGRGGSH